MRPLRGTHPNLSTALDGLSQDALRKLVIRIILSSADSFISIPEVREAHAVLVAGGGLGVLDATRLHDCYERLEQRELEMAETEGAEDERDGYFRAGRFVYALSVAAGGIDVERVDNLLYDMAHAFDDQNGFWDAALREVESLGRE